MPPAIAVALAAASPLIVFSAVIRNRRQARQSTEDDHGAKTQSREASGGGHFPTGGLMIWLLAALLFAIPLLAVLALKNVGGTSWRYADKFLYSVGLAENSGINCAEWSNSYKPEDLVGIYGDMSGQYHRDIGVSSPLVSTLFDQGMVHIYGFNTAEGLRNFKAALSADPECYMCHWGIAYASGPNINLVVTEEMAAEGKEAITRASKIIADIDARSSTATGSEKTVVKTASPANRALIKAVASRLSFEDTAEWTERGQHYYDKLFVEAMTEAMTAHPDDVDIGAIYADSLMNLSPWKYYTPGTTGRLAVVEQINDLPKVLLGGDESFDPVLAEEQAMLDFLPHVRPAYEKLKWVIENSPNNRHPLALHMWIHVTEQGKYPKLGEKEADYLASLNNALARKTGFGFSSSSATSTGTAHLLHMPAHTYLRVGRYSDCISASIRAVSADLMYEKKCLEPYFPRHNRALLIYAALFNGREQLALQYSPYGTVDKHCSKYIASVCPISKDLIYTRFGDWESVLDLQKRESPGSDRLTHTSTDPSLNYLVSDLPYIKAVQTYARTLALVGLGQLDDAKTSLTHLREFALSIPYDDMPEEDPFYPYQHQKGSIMQNIAEAAYSLKGSNNVDRAIELLEAAVAEQDSWSYMEPENFHFPVRHCLGALYVKKADDVLAIQSSGTPLSGPEVSEVRDALTSAIKVYEMDLIDHPKNGWAWKGLEGALTRWRSLKTTSSSLRAGTSVSASAAASVSGMGAKVSVNVAEESAVDRFDKYDMESVRKSFAAAWSEADPRHKNIKGSCCELSLC